MRLFASIYDIMNLMLDHVCQGHLTEERLCSQFSTHTNLDSLNAVTHLNAGS